MASGLDFRFARNTGLIRIPFSCAIQSFDTPDALPEFASVQGDPADHLALLKQFVSDRGIALEYSASIAPARGISRGGSIALLPDLSPADEFAVLSHEIAHELLHRGGAGDG